MHRRILVFSLLAFGFSSRVDAATIIFDVCTEASLCGQVNYLNVLQPGSGHVPGGPEGVIEGSITNFRFNGISVLQFAVNLSSDVNTYFFDRGSHTALGPGNLGPFGEFTTRWLQAGLQDNILIGFTDPSGPFSDDLEPFLENSQGFFMAAEVRDRRTGVTGFVAARLNDVTPVPEPGTLLLLASGLLVAARRARQPR